MKPRVLAVWISLLLVAVSLRQPAPPAAAQKPDLWSPANPTTGGIVFLVNPADADIYVDGSYAGRPMYFSPARPLILGAGQHRVELKATGYFSSRLDVAVLPGLVMTCDVVMDRR